MESSWFLFDCVQRVCGLGGRSCKSNEQTKPAVPSYEPWRETCPVPYAPTEPAKGYPSALSLHLFTSGLTGLIMISMWFYSMHLRTYGISWMTWVRSTYKLINPCLTFNDFKWPVLILPHCKFKDLPLLASCLWSRLMADTYSPQTDKPQAAKAKPAKQGSLSQTQRLVLSTLASLTAIQSSHPLQLRSDRQFHQRLRKFKSPVGGLNTNKLRTSTSKSSVYTALLSKLQADTYLFQDAIPDGLQIDSCVVDSGASFTSVNNQKFVVPGTLQKIEDPIEVDGIVNGLTVDQVCQVEFECVDKDGNPFPIRTTAYYHEELPCMLLSPQAFLQDQHLQKL